MNKQNLFLATVLLSLSSGAFADSWSCRHDDNVREIHIETPTSDTVPCSVVYRKLTEGMEDRVLWTAENDASYCLEKAQGLVDKQASWGWTCVETLSEKNTDDSTLPSETTTNETPAAQEAPATSDPATSTTEQTGASNETSSETSSDISAEATGEDLGTSAKAN